ncbi:AraC family transcriptional regulator [Snuella sedimenti]|uniref:Helix-turn-helix transcriptional regulator n=1 Tax=Snuella sedimenti TaxID=2798802 RepID=A0A8J7JCT8_9FLAO|nr:AraC family transcriptional regulator [Snuella sedimenti]MBJ6368614.1 helix-turn-helix transcriptional regulator [Snuella sedimenti]
MQELDKVSTEERQIIDLEGLGFDCIKVLGSYNYRQMNKSLEMHVHENMIEICFLEKGTQYYHIQGEDYRINGGDLLLTFPGEEHGTKSFPEERGRLFWLIMEVPDKNRRLLNLTKKETKLFIESFMSLKSNRKFKGSDRLKHDLNAIYQICKHPIKGLDKIKITNLLLHFLLNVLEFGNKHSNQTISKDISETCAFINDNLNESLPLEHLAQLSNLSLSHFKYKFKKEMGYSPTDYILRQKIEKSKEQLLIKTNSIQDVAYNLAFSSSSYFATVFKRYTGITPTQHILLS